MRAKLITQKNQFPPKCQWEEPEEAFRTYSKAEMSALRAAQPAQFFALSSWRIILGQVVVTLLSAVICSFFGSPLGINLYTQSALVGGLIGFLPASVFLLRLQIASNSTKPSAGQFLAAVISGELIKITLTLALFVGFAVKQPDLKWLPLLLTYFLTLKCYWFMWRFKQVAK
ncbi:ATP synthase subunit I [Polynucleobacter sp. IMCC30063]|uniref:ATP synthase subunit I n=1 Tax=unclassified Polynucleobacter TaxID=2640945 RepID=UPI001F44339F|nr:MULTISPECIES: ATP synthase subunit I [unclassified Polynucleobacter]MCE7504897.1 ATP synthase subunit I [Polynucleobacter sp. IMCC30063]MCE7526313.1 ATP synthase subunit I [Polynucleobacter sp. IMCC 30228]MCE7528618.1 ATP synthase subunit I [Polynucleobacter sp. IMCC 29146]